MILACNTLDYPDGFYDYLQTSGIDVISLPLMRIEMNVEAEEWFIQHCNEYDYIIISSSTLIDVASDKLQRVIRGKFVVSGAASAKKLGEISRLKILYPSKNSGLVGMIHEVLEKIHLAHSKILILVSQELNPRLKDYLEDVGCSYKPIEIFRKFALDIDEQLKKSVESSKLRGIIITSSAGVDIIYQAAARLNLWETIAHIPFITLHSNIKDKLMALGVLRVMVSALVSKESMVAILRSLK